MAFFFTTELMDTAQLVCISSREKLFFWRGWEEGGEGFLPAVEAYP